MNEQTRLRAAAQIASQPEPKYKDFDLDEYLQTDDVSFFALVGETIKDLKSKYTDEQALKIAKKLDISESGINKIWAAIHEKINN